MDGRSSPAPPRLAGLAAAATLIAVLTALARLTGFARVFVFNATVGNGCTGAAYAAANQLPNVLFEVVAGGALAGALVPVLSGMLTSGRAADADRTASALLTWAVVGLLPLSALLAVLAGPLARLLVTGSATAADCRDAADLAALTTRMILVFAPQIVLYGVGVVLTGVLQARHRFAGPAVAPLLSSLVVIGAYGLFGLLGAGPHGDPQRLPGLGPELVLTVGTTLGVAVLSLPLLVPAHRAGARLRPALRFPPGAVHRLRSLALAGVLALLAQQAAVLVTLALAFRVGGDGAPTVVQNVQAVYLLPYAVLAVPVATATFPRLAEQATAGRSAAFAATAAAGVRTMIVLGLLGTALLAGAAPAVQALFRALDDAGGGALGSLAESLTWFAAGLAGWALVAFVTRALYALGRPRPAVTAAAAGWGLVAVASVGVALGLRAAGVPGLRASLVGLGSATSAGMLLAAAVLLPALRRAAGPGALAGAGRAAAVGVAGALVGGVAGRAVASALTPDGAGAGARGARAAVVATGVGALSAMVALVGFAVVAWWFEAPRAPRAAGAPPRVALVLATSAGGVGRHVAALAAWLPAAGVPVRVAGPRATEAAFGLPGLGVEFAPIEIADRPRPTADLRALLRLRAVTGAVDVVHAHGLRAGALTVLAARTRRHRPLLVVTLHNALVGSGRTAAVHALLARIVARGADVVLVVSPDLGERARALGARRVERALVPAPARPRRSTPAATRASLRVRADEHLLVTVARLAPQKGLDLFLDSVERLADLPVRAIVAGDGPLEAQLAAGVAERRLPVTLLGRRDDVEDLLAAADVVVVPSVWEGQPLVVQEALRAGAATVATDVGGVRETAGDGVVLVPPADPAGLAAAVRTLLTDAAAAATLRDRARARAALLPSDGDAGWQVLSIYREVAAGWSPRPEGRPGSGPGEAADTLEARGAADS